ncbi:hypothetical protein TSUD_134150 [Trifolium subterraneum]|uniref:Uncharacterized protein n=1 Tax=Trifolium subterraneum TaxID=3900 RepID=A0A2Z6NLX2_TRISU|nr:hypothetical protein TSUD_134150 [Trifolium subterraneum]
MTVVEAAAEIEYLEAFIGGYESFKKNEDVSAVLFRRCRSDEIHVTWFLFRSTDADRHLRRCRP